MCVQSTWKDRYTCHEKMEWRCQMLLRLIYTTQKGGQGISHSPSVIPIYLSPHAGRVSDGISHDRITSAGIVEPGCLPTGTFGILNSSVVPAYHGGDSLSVSRGTYLARNCRGRERQLSCPGANTVQEQSKNKPFIDHTKSQPDPLQRENTAFYTLPPSRSSLRVQYIKLRYFHLLSSHPTS
jgi:hypothetical protein